MRAPAPQLFGRYVLLKRLGAGGMGEIYAALSGDLRGLQKICAVKKVLPALSRRRDFLTRFRDEARVAIAMAHPNVVSVYEIGAVGDAYFLAMELVEGYDLERVMRRARRHGGFSVPAALFITREILAALDYCHRLSDADDNPLNLVHRDVSPSNVLLGFDGQVKLSDFGLALSETRVAQTLDGRIWGKPGYVAPERLLQQEPDQRIDIFAVGALLFEMLTGESPMPRLDPTLLLDTMHARCKTPPSSIRRGLSPEIDALVSCSLAFDRDERFSTARAFHDATQELLARHDPLFGAARLSEAMMQHLFQPRTWRSELSALAREAESLIGADKPQEPRNARIFAEVIPISPGARLTVEPDMDTDPGRISVEVSAMELQDDDDDDFGLPTLVRERPRNNRARAPVEQTNRVRQRRRSLPRIRRRRPPSQPPTSDPFEAEVTGVMVANGPRETREALAGLFDSSDNLRRETS